MNYKFYCENENSAAQALFELRPSVVATFETDEVISERVVFEIAEGVLSALSEIVPAKEEIEGFFIARESPTNRSESRLGRDFCFALRGPEDHSYFNEDAVEILRGAVKRASQDSDHGQRVKDAHWQFADGKKFVSNIYRALINPEMEQIDLCSDSVTFCLSVYPVSGREIDKGDIGSIATFFGIYPSKAHMARSRKPLDSFALLFDQFRANRQPSLD